MGEIKKMDKITNCPNNTFDCGVSCGLYIAVEGILEVMEKFEDDDKRIELLTLFKNSLREDIEEKHLEHMDQRYGWKKHLEKVLK